MQFGKVEGHVPDGGEIHEQEGEHGHQEAPAALNEDLPRPLFLPDDGHPFNGPGEDDHGEEGDGQPADQPEAVADDAEHADDADHQNHQRRDAGHEQQVQMGQVGAYDQADGDDQNEADDARQQLRLQEGQGDQHGHEGARGADADDDPHEHHHQGAHRQQHDQLEHPLLGDGQAVQRKARPLRGLGQGQRGARLADH